jgi:hypothetical protein
MQDFKAAIARREIPRNILFLSRILIVIIISLIAIAITDYRLKLKFIERAKSMSQFLVATEQRTIKLIETAIHIRSFVDVSNGLEDPIYPDAYLKRYNRFIYLRQLI